MVFWFILRQNSRQAIFRLKCGMHPFLILPSFQTYPTIRPKKKSTATGELVVVDMRRSFRAIQNGDRLPRSKRVVFVAVFWGVCPRFGCVGCRKTPRDAFEHQSPQGGGAAKLLQRICGSLSVRRERGRIE